MRGQPRAETSLAPSFELRANSDSDTDLILLIDNYDSFVHNLARYFRLLGHETKVVRNDQITPRKAAALQPQAIVLSPGPGTPQQAGCCIELVKQLHQSIPILGICLGHQAIGFAFGALVDCANRPMHGQTSTVRHKNSPLFTGFPNPMVVGRYHSLIVDAKTLPPALRPTAWTDDKVVMAMEHEKWPLVGLQFHPESILTEEGLPLIERFLEIAEAKPAYPEMDSTDQQQWSVAAATLQQVH